MTAFLLATRRVYTGRASAIEVGTLRAVCTHVSAPLTPAAFGSLSTRQDHADFHLEPPHFGGAARPLAAAAWAAERLLSAGESGIITTFDIHARVPRSGGVNCILAASGGIYLWQIHDG